MRAHRTLPALLFLALLLGLAPAPRAAMAIPALRVLDAPGARIYDGKALDGSAYVIVWRDKSGVWAVDSRRGLKGVGLKLPPGEPSAPLVLSGNGAVIAGAYGSRLATWDPATGAEKWSSTLELSNVDRVALSDDGSIVAALSRADQVLELWTVGGERRLRQKLKFTPRAVAFTPTPDRLLVTGQDHRVYALNTKKGRLEPLTQGGLPGAVAVSPDGRLLAVADTVEPDNPAAKGAVHLYRWDTGAKVRDFEVDTERGDYSAVVFSADGRYLLAGGPGGMRAWELIEFQQIYNVGAAGFHLSVNPDGLNLLVDLPTQIFVWSDLPATLLELHTVKGGCLKGDCANGPGIYARDGVRYEGEYKDGRYHGPGARIYADGCAWRGKFAEGRPTGTGRYTGILGEQQDGRWEDFFGTCTTGNCESGTGSVRYADGATYSGAFLHGRPHGTGTMRQADGMVEQGRWIGGTPHGWAIQTLPGGKPRPMSYRQGVYYGDCDSGDCVNGTGVMKMGGATYHGQFRDGLPHGQGKVELSLTGEVVEGAFSEGIAVDATWTDAAGAVFKGRFDRHHKPQEGEIRWKDGMRYVGPVRNGAPQGEGTLHTPDGATITGRFEKGQLSQGEMTLKDGTRYVGPLKNLAAHGEGTVTLPDGRVQKGTFENGVLKSAPPAGK